MTEIIRKTADFILINPKTIDIKIDPDVVQKNKYYEAPKPYWLYALKLEGGKHYVGFTGKRNPYDRIMEHVEGEGARWTQIHKPIEVLEVRDAGEMTLTQIQAFEQNLTWAYMTKYGANNVRGGKFNYTGRIIPVGKNKVIMGYTAESFFAGVAFTVAILIIYLEISYYLNR